MDILKDIKESSSVEALQVIYREHKPIFMELKADRRASNNELTAINAKIELIDVELAGYPEADVMLSAFYLRLGELTKSTLD